MMKNWERKLAEYFERNGDEVMNDVTRRQLLIDMQPDDAKKRRRWNVGISGHPDSEQV